MTQNANSIKDHIKDVVLSHWKTNQTPYLISQLSGKFTKQQIKKETNDLPLLKWIKENDDLGVKIVVHPSQKQKIGQMWFEFGHERHAKPSTGGDHDLLCDLKANFRFGCRIDYQRHYNASLENNRAIDDYFYDCHNEIKLLIRNKTHLNIFSNDYISNSKK